MESIAHNPPTERRRRAPIFALAATVIVAVAASAFAAGWLIGRILS